MNKYFVTIPYDCVQYGKMSCYIYAENEADAIELAYESENRISEEYEDGDQDGTSRIIYKFLLIIFLNYFFVMITLLKLYHAVFYPKVSYFSYFVFAQEFLYMIVF